MGRSRSSDGGGPGVMKIQISKGDVDVTDALRVHLQARDEGNDERTGVVGGLCGHVLRRAVAAVRFQDGDAAIGFAMTAMVNEVIPGALTRALASLDIACRDLDAAVLAMPDVG